jgi:rhodanese-related sulfurtransferase
MGGTIYAPPRCITPGGLAVEFGTPSVTLDMDMEMDSPIVVYRAAGIRSARTAETPQKMR